MTATDELRRLLDERGVEWMDDSYAQLWSTVWHGRDGKQWRLTENRSGMLTELKAWQATPEQAIEATLGSDLQAENDKLRELVRKVDHYERLGCYECPHSSSCEVGTLYDEDCAMSREIEREKRELGIEVDA